MSFIHAVGNVRVGCIDISYTRWCMPHCGQAKIKARSQALVVRTELTRSMIIGVF